MLKHGWASSEDLLLQTKVEGGLLLRIRNNGIGFDTQAAGCLHQGYGVSSSPR